MVPALLATALLASGAPPAPADPLAGCTEVFSAMSMITLGCPGELFVIANADDDKPGRSVEILRQRLEGMGAGPVHQSRGRMRLGGADREVVRLSSVEGGIRAVAVTLASPGGSTRFLACGSREAGESRCARVLEALASDGLPARFAARVARPEKPIVGGRGLVLPAGCEVRRLSQTHGHVSCAGGTTHFGWVEAEREVADVTFARQVESLRTGLAKGSWEDRVPCSARHRRGSCRRGRGIAGGVETEVVLGRWKVRGTHLVAFCIYPAARGLPEPCSQVIALGDGTPP